MQRQIKMSCIKAWLDDRGKTYSQVDAKLRIKYGTKQLFIEFSNREYLVDGKSYKSQKAVINEVLNPFYGGPYKEV